MVVRRKTLVVDFNAFQVRLDAAKLQQFLGNDTKWSLADINSILHTRNCVFSFTTEKRRMSNVP